jgi:predicted AlkP superfamily pyrophosphatase or phosphodiesterase
MERKVIMVLVDALRDDTARDQMGYMQHLVEAQLATRYTSIGELPSMSRPMYETLHTGVTVSQHGITSNRIVRRSQMPNVFQLARDAGKTTAAAAHAWFSELYNHAPYDPAHDVQVDDPERLIQHGRFYLHDGTPDSEVFAWAANLVQRYSPDYLLVHPMGQDYLGELHGADSSQYRNNAIRLDAIIGTYFPGWLAQDYFILVTADHGINNDKLHGGTTPELRNCPLYLIDPRAQGEGDTQSTVSMLCIAPTLCTLLGMDPPSGMTHPSLV